MTHAEPISVPTRKLADAPLPCASRDHAPPLHMVLEPGIYEHVCSACGAKVLYTVQGASL